MSLCAAVTAKGYPPGTLSLLTRDYEGKEIMGWLTRAQADDAAEEDYFSRHLEEPNEQQLTAIYEQALLCVLCPLNSLLPPVPGQTTQEKVKSENFIRMLRSCFAVTSQQHELYLSAVQNVSNPGVRFPFLRLLDRGRYSHARVSTSCPVCGHSTRRWTITYSTQRSTMSPRYALSPYIAVCMCVCLCVCKCRRPVTRTVSGRGLCGRVEGARACTAQRCHCQAP